jgi:hypothetical protein
MNGVYIGVHVTYVKPISYLYIELMPYFQYIATNAGGVINGMQVVMVRM